MRARKNLDLHLSDETLILLLSDELDTNVLARAERHLANCWQCRARHERLDHATQKIVAYGKHMAGMDSNESPGSRDPFLKKLERACREATDRSWWVRLVWRLRGLKASRIAHLPAGVASVMSVVAIAVLLWRNTLPTVSASTFLEHALNAEAKFGGRETSGVVYQKIRVRTRQGTFERVVYRDVSGHRQLRSKRPSKPDLEFQAKLAIAGVNWESPLSVGNFKNWHDGQSNIQDSVERSKYGLLTLTTSVGDGIVRRQSLTVRESTFHPVERTVEFTDIGLVEFEELNYDILGWNSVNADLFDPLPSFAPLAASIVRTPQPAPLSGAELDEVELRARLALNEVNADFTERLQLNRMPTGIRVIGIVGTEGRKHEIAARLERETHVSVSIQTFAEVRRRPSASSEVTSIQSGSIAAQTPAFVSYLVTHGRSPEESARISHDLFDSAFTAQQEVNAIFQLRQRFQKNELTEAGAAAFDALIAHHRRALGAAVREEERVLAGIGFVLPPMSSTAPSEDLVPDVAQQAERDLILCQELTAGRDNKSVDVEHVVPEILHSLGVLQGLVQESQPEVRAEDINRQ